MDYVVGAYAPRLDRKLTEQQQQAVQGELYLQLLKNRSGKARPAGVRCTLDPETGRLTQFGQIMPLPVQLSPYQQQLGQSRPAPDLPEAG
jgi:hypothetical protein